MIHFKIYNDDKLRHWDGFPKLNDPYVLELTLLRIINELFSDNSLPELKEFNIRNPLIYNLFFTYYTSSNFNSWGELPLGYIYNDMIRHIQNQNTSNNFIMTLESIFIDQDSSERSYSDPTGSNVAYEIITSYISENYLNSYSYITNNSNGVLVALLPKQYGIKAYIISVGFDPMNMSKWFCTKRSNNDLNVIPFARYNSLVGIMYSKLGSNRLSLSKELDLTIRFECGDGRTRESINGCNSLVQSYEIFNLRKKSEYDTEIRYGNYPVDYNWLNIYDSSSPAALMLYTSKTGEKLVLNRFNQPSDYRVDYRLLRKQNDMIKVVEKRKEMNLK